jgi:hypothetical protein
MEAFCDDRIFASKFTKRAIQKLLVNFDLFHKLIMAATAGAFVLPYFTRENFFFFLFIYKK